MSNFDNYLLKLPHFVSDRLTKCKKFWHGTSIDIIILKIVSWEK